MKLVEDVQKLLAASPEVAAVLGLPHRESFPQLAGNLLGGICQNPAIGKTIGRIYRDNPTLIDTTLHDIYETARRNFEPGGEAATFLFARGVHAVMAHRIAHKLWSDGDTNHALALKTALGRAFSTDIHPAAQIGAGLWLDHGLGVVIGETCVIEEDVSIWHNVTLGSTLNDSGNRRHPHVETGAVIGAGAIILGGITIGANANIAAGAIVTNDVPKATLAVGSKATLRGPARVSFSKEKASE
jgi:serine O-acetyltransferase